MKKHYKIFSLKILHLFLTILFLLVQSIPYWEDESISYCSTDQFFSEDNISVFNVINNSNQPNVIRNNSQVNSSPANYFYNKNDLICIPGITDSKRIHNGGFSYNFRYRTFLTAIFSTST
jgi:exopolysaccharide biosynthesis protein